jgi:hypothetical protein
VRRRRRRLFGVSAAGGLLLSCGPHSGCLLLVPLLLPPLVFINI